MVNIWRAGCFGEMGYGVRVDKSIARHISIKWISFFERISTEAVTGRELMTSPPSSCSILFPSRPAPQIAGTVGFINY